MRDQVETNFRMLPEGGIPIPDWVKAAEVGHLRTACRQRILMFQFHVMHIGFHEEWLLVPFEMDPDDIARGVITSARQSYDEKWKGTSIDMRCLGGAVYDGEGDLMVLDMRDIK